MSLESQCKSTTFMAPGSDLSAAPKGRCPGFRAYALKGQYNLAQGLAPVVGDSPNKKCPCKGLIMCGDGLCAPVGGIMGCGHPIDRGKPLSYDI